MGPFRAHLYNSVLAVRLEILGERLQKGYGAGLKPASGLTLLRMADQSTRGLKVRSGNTFHAHHRLPGPSSQYDRPK
jgi:hypothetical protein